MKLFSYLNPSETPQELVLQEAQMSKKTEDYVTREFITGDEEALTRLFNSTRSELAGFVPIKIPIIGDGAV